MAHPWAALLIVVIVAFFSTSDIVELFPALDPFTSSALFPYVHGIEDLISLSLILLSAYKYSNNLAFLTLTVYLAWHIPSAALKFPTQTDELPRILYTTVVGVIGIMIAGKRRLAEANMAQTNHDLEIAQQLTKIGNWKWDIASGEVEWSKGLCLINKWDPQEKPPAFSQMSPFYTPESWKRLSESVAEAVKTGMPYYLELNQIQTDGMVIRTETRGEADFDKHGKITGLHGTVKDISESKRAQEQILHLADMLRTIRSINQLITREKDRERLIQKSCELLFARENLDEVWILLFDTGGDIAMGSSRTHGKESTDFLRQLKSGSYPECMMQVLAPGETSIFFEKPGISHKNCVLAPFHSLQDTLRGKLEYDGRTYGVIGIAGTQGTVFDAEESGLFNELCGDISFALESIRQERERKQAEEARRVSDENFRHSVDDSPLGIRILNNLGETVYANRALLEIYGFTTYEDFNRIPTKKLYTPEAYIEHHKRVEKRARGEFVPPSYETSIVRTDGKIRHMEVVRKDVIWNGKPQFQQLYLDMTELKTLQEQLIMQDRLVSIGQLVSGVAHELNNPLTSVIGFSELLLAKDLPDDIKSDLTIVNQEAKRTSSIVKNLLTFARQQPQEKMPININLPIQTVLMLRSHDQSVNGVTVKVNLAFDLPLVMANISQMQQVFFNIITNAEFAMIEAHQKGTITIITENAGKNIRVSISDDGPGITPENMKRLFSPFFTTKALGKGTGLGLSICQGIIAEHGGRIWAESEPGTGATFKVEIPCARMNTDSPV